MQLAIIVGAYLDGCYLVHTLDKVVHLCGQTCCQYGLILSLISFALHTVIMEMIIQI